MMWVTRIWLFINLVHILEIEISVNLIGKRIKEILSIVPVQTCRTEKGSGPFMIEASSRFDILQNMWSQRLPLGCNPVNNCIFHTLHVISMGPIYTFLNLGLKSAGC